MLSVSGGLFSRVLEADDVTSLKDLFEVTASDYWDDHFVFGKKSRNVPKNTGTQATEIFLINAVIPVLFVYGRNRDHSDVCGRALDFLEEIHTEDNVITREWAEAGIDSESAFCSQALIQLRNEYCKKRRCLDCRIGSRLISQGRQLKDHTELILEP